MARINTRIYLEWLEKTLQHPEREIDKKKETREYKKDETKPEPTQPTPNQPTPTKPPTQ